MRLLLGLIIPTLTILAPLAILLWIGRRKKRLNRTDFGVAILCSFLIGLIVPVVATYLSVQGFMYNRGPEDPYCATGVVSFLFFGYLINLIGCTDGGYCFIATEAGQGRLVAKGFSPLQYPSVAGEDTRATAYAL